MVRSKANRKTLQAENRKKILRLLVARQDVIIGGILNPFKDLFLESLREKVFVENNFYDSNEFAIMCSALQADAPILGVALLPIEQKFPLYN